jgi:TolA-binding protein
MQKITAFLLKHKREIGYALGVFVIITSLWVGVGRLMAYVESRKIASLEQVIKDSQRRVHQLEGQLQVKNEQLSSVNQQLEDSNNRLIEAAANTDKVRTVYVNTKKNGPTFVSTDDQGRIKELGDTLNSLYP